METTSHNTNFSRIVSLTAKLYYNLHQVPFLGATPAVFSDAQDLPD